MRTWGLWVMVSLGACSSGNSLDGSIGASFDLDFDRVSIRLINEQLAIEYLKDIPGADEPERVVQVFVETNRVRLGDDTNLTGDTFLEVVTIRRVSATGTESFPDLQSGRMHLDKYRARDGATVRGNFDAFFVNGRNIQGDFDHELEIVQDTD